MTYAESRSRFARRRWPVLRKSRHGVRLNEHLENPEGAVVFQHACKMGLEGIVSKRLGSRYRSGRSTDRLKFKNPEAPAVMRESGRGLGEITLGRSLVASFFANRLLGELSRLRSSASRASLVHVRAMSSRMSRTRGVEARSANH